MIENVQLKDKGITVTLSCFCFAAEKSAIDEFFRQLTVVILRQ